MFDALADLAVAVDAASRRDEYGPRPAERAERIMADRSRNRAPRPALARRLAGRFGSRLPRVKESTQPATSWAASEMLASAGHTLFD
jgi:hypothetical protein